MPLSTHSSTKSYSEPDTEEPNAGNSALLIFTKLSARHTLNPAVSISVSVFHFRITFELEGVAWSEDNEIDVCGQQAASCDLHDSKAAIK